MHNHNKEDLTLDVVSAIDEDIVDVNLKKRFALWLKKGRRKTPRWIPIVAVAACLCIVVTSLALLLPSQNGLVPVYRGMTVSNDPPISEQAQASAPEVAAKHFVGAHTALLSNANAMRPLGIAALSKEKTTATDKINQEQSKTDAPDIEFGKTYYALKNEDVYIHIHLSNPAEYEILSFTLNGKKYSSNMFEYGSDLQTLILKYNVGDVDGLQEYTIDAIKYVDGEKIKGVRMDGDRTVKVFVNDDSQALKLGAKLEGFRLTIAPSFAEDFTGDKVITSLSLWREEEKLRELDVNAVEIDELPVGERLILKATYNDENGKEQTLQYVFETRKQSEGLAITNGVITGIGTFSDSVLYVNMPVSNNAFQENLFIEEVYFGPDVEYIEKEAFLGATALQKIVFSNGIETIGDGAFASCYNLQTAELSSSLQSIGDAAFHSCRALTEITLGESVTQLGADAFYDCASLETLHIQNSKIKLKAGVSWPYDPASGEYKISPTGRTFDDCPALSVYFNGTSAEWATATSEIPFWLEARTVHCSDKPVVISSFGLHLTLTEQVGFTSLSAPKTYFATGKVKCYTEFEVPLESEEFERVLEANDMVVVVATGEKNGAPWLLFQVLGEGFFRFAPAADFSEITD